MAPFAPTLATLCMHRQLQAAVRSMNSSGFLRSQKALLDVLHQQGDLIYSQLPVSEVFLFQQK